MRYLLAWIVAVVTSILLTVPVVCADDWIRVRWVDDGDTMVLMDGRRVRYLGINAPEIANDKYGKKADPLGYEALALNRHLVKGKRVRLELDRETHDGYGRLLAYVYLRGNQLINEQMVLNGLAYFYPHWPNNRYDDLLLKAQRKAMLATRGIWRHWKKNDRKVIGNRRSRRFHASACPDAKKIKAGNRIHFDTPWQAFWEGYAPARDCIKK